jgi:membrane-associated phospholipid phosphatase
VSEIYDLGIQVVIFVQNLGGWLLKPMQLFSILGSATFFLLVAPVLYWCVSTEAGLRVGLFLMFSGTINDALKLALHAPRPYWYSKDVKALAAEMQFGIPSGHSQHAVVVWSAMAAWIKRRWAWITAILLILCISFSRLYLGVHFPTDVLAGWLVGILLVWGLLRYERKLTAWFLSQPLTIQFLAALLTSLGMIGLVAAARLSVGDWQMPSDWAENAARAGEGIPNPLDPTGVITNAGAFFGIIAGAIVLRRNGGFEARKGTEWQMAARYSIGLAGTLILWYGLGVVFPREADFLSYVLRYLRYALVGMWFTGLAPLAFIRLGLAEPKPRY